MVEQIEPEAWTAQALPVQLIVPEAQTDPTPSRAWARAARPDSNSIVAVRAEKGCPGAPSAVAIAEAAVPWAAAEVAEAEVLPWVVAATAEVAAVEVAEAAVVVVAAVGASRRDAS